jgi:hypothetical protein
MAIFGWWTCKVTRSGHLTQVQSSRLEPLPSTFLDIASSIIPHYLLLSMCPFPLSMSILMLILLSQSL